MAGEIGGACVERGGASGESYNERAEEDISTKTMVKI
jgi:hypothetical protein